MLLINKYYFQIISGGAEKSIGRPSYRECREKVSGMPRSVRRAEKSVGRAKKTIENAEKTTE